VGANFAGTLLVLGAFGFPVLRNYAVLIGTAAGVLRVLVREFYWRPYVEERDRDQAGSDSKPASGPSSAPAWSARSLSAFCSVSSTTGW